MIAPCGFTFSFPDISNVEHFFMDVGHLHIIFGKIFICCNFILLIFLFLCRRLVWWSSVCVFVLLLPLLLISYPKNHHQDQSQGAYGFFIVPVLFFKSLIHFELDIEYGIWYNFILLHVPVQLFFSEPFIEETLHFLLCSFGFVVIN